MKTTAHAKQTTLISTRLVTILGCVIGLSLAGCGDDGDPAGGNPGTLPTTSGLPTGGGGGNDPTGETSCTTDADCASMGSQACLRGTCNTAAGQCYLGPVPDGTACDTGNACIKAQICAAGSCSGGQPVTCDDGDDCTTDACDPSVGCTYAPLDNCGGGGSCTPACDGKSCGSDGCGGVCGFCGAGESCQSGQCINVEGCEASCDGKSCGDDGCGGSCGSCAAGWSCDNGSCVGGGGCTPNCNGKTCGADGCGGSCGTCGGGKTCQNGQCSGGSCTPNCGNKACGDDGCGGSCGSCAANETCSFFGECEPCQPSCQGKECGDNGCGGTCGSCAGGEVCGGGGQCEEPGAGHSCDSPYPIGALPFSSTNDTTGASNDYSMPAGACPGGSASEGDSSPDHVYDFIANKAGSYRFELSTTGLFYGVMYLITECDSVADSCLGTAVSTWNSGEVMTYLDGGQKVYVVIDGHDSSFDSEAGIYTLTVEEVEDCAQKDCDGKTCGDDGCGGLCGVCGDGQVCGPDSNCMDADQGLTCSKPFEVGDLPFLAQGATEDGDSNFSVEADTCPGEDISQGAYSPEHIYRFDPPNSGNYRFKLSPEGFWYPAMYISTSCQEPDSNCMTLGNDSWQDIEETIYLNWSDEVFVFIDGYDNDQSWSDQWGGYTLKIEAQEDCAQKDCDGKTCGDDGCGGYCGSCGGDQICGPDSNCMDADQGDTCSKPFQVDAVPFEVESTTETASNDYGVSATACPELTSGQGDYSNDHVYAFTAPSSGNYEFKLKPGSGFWGTMYLVESCGDIEGTCVAGDKISSLSTMSLTAYLQAGQELFAIVDGYDSNNSWGEENGAYTFSVDVAEDCWSKDCDGKNCGDDGCGGLCGVCTGGDACSGAGVCTEVTVGESCADPFTLSGLPEEVAGDTTNALNLHQITGGACAGSWMSNTSGVAGPDHAYVFMPLESGTYRFEVQTPDDAPTPNVDFVLYVVDDCGALPDGGCLEGSGDWTPTVDLIMDAFDSVVLIVDTYGFADDGGPYILKVDKL